MSARSFRRKPTCGAADPHRPAAAGIRAAPPILLACSGHAREECTRLPSPATPATRRATMAARTCARVMERGHQGPEAADGVRPTSCTVQARPPITTVPSPWSGGTPPAMSARRTNTVLRIAETGEPSSAKPISTYLRSTTAGTAKATEPTAARCKATGAALPKSRTATRFRCLSKSIMAAG